MSTLIDEVRLILVEANSNHNKWWTGELYDDNRTVTRWGRVGMGEQSKEFPGCGKDFLEKKKREKLKKGYSELKTVKAGPQVASIGSDVAKQNLIQIAIDQIAGSNTYLQKLVRRLVDSNVHKITNSTNIKFNDATGLFSTPLGIVTPDGVTEARNLLVDIKQFVDASKFTDTSLGDKVNLFLRLVPQNIGMGKFNASKIFPNSEAIEKQNDILDALESSYQTLQAKPVTSSTDQKSIPEKVFSVSMDLLSDKNEYKRVEDWFNNSKKSGHGYNHVKIAQIYKIDVHDVSNGFNAALGNIEEVWHGTSEANLLSIMKSGLKVSPPSTAFIAGKMFGNGVYGAKASTKSLGYSTGRWGGSSGDSSWLFVLDFAMGRIFHTKSSSQPKSNTDSTWGHEGPSLRNDELIVFKNSQIKIKYLLECK